MLYARQNSIAGFHLYAHHLLSFLESTPEAQQLLERFGYTVQRLQEGRQLLDQAQAAYRSVQELRSTQKDATRSLHQDWDRLRRRYQVQSATARRVLGKEMAQVRGRAPRGYSHWVNEAQDFYAAMLRTPAFLEKLAEASITPEELSRSAQLIQELMNRKNNQTHSRRNLLDGNHNRQRQQEDLRIWIQELLRVAPLAFRNQPGLLSALHALAPRPQVGKKGTGVKREAPAGNEVAADGGAKGVAEAVVAETTGATVLLPTTEVPVVVADQVVENGI